MLNNDSTIKINIDKKLKKEAEEILHNLGIETSTLVTMLYKQIVSKKCIPFNESFIDDNFYDDNFEQMLIDSKKGKKYTVKQLKKII